MPIVHERIRLIYHGVESRAEVPVGRAPLVIAVTLGAFLLFLVQPMAARFILPWFGGGPAVWSTCLLFFQVALLAGYAYAHLTRRLSLTHQARLHLTLLALAVLTLPIAPSASWITGGVDAGGPPAGRILLLLAATVGDGGVRGDAPLEPSPCRRPHPRRERRAPRHDRSKSLFVACPFLLHIECHTHAT